MPVIDRGSLAGRLATTVVGVAMAVWTWRTWPDVLIDFGRELYVPWRLAEGEVLFRDLAWFNGPLSPYWNSLWFRVFGESLMTLVVVNLGLTILLAILLWRIVAEIADELAACVSVVVFLTVFAFGQLDSIGNYNYATPYSHEMTHGLLLSLLAVFLITRGSRWGVASLVSSGLVLGLVFLTKAELCLGAVAACGGGLVLRGTRGARDALIVFTSGLLPPAVAWLLLRQAMPAGEALRGVLGAWPSVFDPAVRALPFYQSTLGTGNLTVNLQALFLVGGIYLLFLATLSLATLRMRSARLRGTGAQIAIFCVVTVLMTAVPLSWQEMVRPLPLILGVLLAAGFLALRRDEPGPAPQSARVLRLMVLAFALVLLAKVSFNVRLVHYGFVLAMPGTLVLVMGLVTWWPDWVEGRGGAGGVARAAGLAAVAALILGILPVKYERMRHRVEVVSAGSDRFLAGGVRARLVQEALQEIEARIAPGDSLLVLPEGIMLNYLSRRVTPTRFVNFMPPELTIFGEAQIRKALQANPADFVILAHRDAREYGARWFGQDFGRSLLAWVREDYRTVHRIGKPPYREDTDFGLEILERVDRVDSQAPETRASQPERW